MSNKFRFVAVTGPTTRNKDDYFECGRKVSNVLRYMNKYSDLLVTTHGVGCVETWTRKLGKQLGFRVMQVDADSVGEAHDLMAQVADIAVVITDDLGMEKVFDNHNVPRWVVFR
jgi:hypothetical protein